MNIFPYPGSKWGMISHIVPHIPNTPGFLDLFCGSGAVLLSKPRAKLETINDLNSDIVNFFTVVRECPEDLARQVMLTPWARDEHRQSYAVSDDPVERARRWLVRTWQGHGSKEYRPTTWRFRSTISGGIFSKAWAEVPAEIMVVAERLLGVQIENMDALLCLRKHANSDTTVYADPPYMCTTRNDRHYRHEMDDAEHLPLLEGLIAHPGPVVLSGYASPLYEEMLSSWTCHTFITKAEAHAREQNRVECLWVKGVTPLNEENA